MWLKDKLFNRRIEGESSIDSLLNTINTIVLDDTVNEIHISDGNYVIDYSNRTIDADVNLEFDSEVIIVFGYGFDNAQVGGLEGGLCNVDSGSFMTNSTFRGQLSISRIGCIVVISFGEQSV